MDHLQHFLSAKRDLEKIHSDYITKLRQEHARFVAEVKTRLAEIDGLVAQRVQQEVQNQLMPVELHIQQIHAKLKQHFGT